MCQRQGISTASVQVLCVGGTLALRHTVQVLCAGGTLALRHTVPLTLIADKEDKPSKVAEFKNASVWVKQKVLRLNVTMTDAL